MVKDNLNKFQVFKFFLGFFISAFFLKLFISNIKWNDFFKILYSINYILIAFVFLVITLTYIIRICRWNILSCNPSNWYKNNINYIYFYSCTLNVLLPFRAGDIYRVYKLRSRESGLFFNVSNLIIERSLDFFVVFLLFIVFNFSNLFMILDKNLIYILFLIFIFLLFSVIFIYFFRLKLMQIRNKFIKNFFVHSKFFRFKSTKYIAKLIGISFLIWISEGLCYWLVAMSLRSELGSGFYIWKIFPIGTLVTLIPSMPGYIGTYDYIMQFSLNLYFEDISAISSYIILIHTILLVSPILLTLIVYLQKKLILKFT